MKILVNISPILSLFLLVKLKFIVHSHFTYNVAIGTVICDITYITSHIEYLIVTYSILMFFDTRS